MRTHGLCVQDSAKSWSQAADTSTEKTQRFLAKSDPLKFLMNDEDIPCQEVEPTGQSQSYSSFVSSSAAESSTAEDRTEESKGVDLTSNVRKGNLPPETPFRGAVDTTSSSATELLFPGSAISSRYMLACISLRMCQLW